MVFKFAMHVAIMLEKKIDFKWACKQEGMEIKFEFIVPGNPQQNGYVEQNFTTLFTRAYGAQQWEIFCFFEKLILG